MRGFQRFHRHLGMDGQRASLRPVAVSFAVGLAIVGAKTSAAALTDSASMLAEAMHSWVALASEGLLVTAYLKARRPADASHPLGYGRDSYVWSMLAALAMLIVGAEVGIWRGIAQWRSGETGGAYWVGYVVVGVAFVMEATSFRQALHFVRATATRLERGLVEHVWKMSDAALRAVFVEDFVALVTLVVAALGMALHQLTGRVEWDAAGSMLIGVLMAATGVVLINLNRQLLAGVQVTPAQRAEILAAIKRAPGVTRVTFLFTEFIGPARILLAAHVGLAGAHDADEIGAALRALEREFMTHKYVGQAFVTLAAPDEHDL